MTTQNDPLDAAIEADLHTPIGPPPRGPQRPRQSRWPLLIVLGVIAILVATPILLAVTGDENAALLGLVTGDPATLFGGVF